MDQLAILAAQIGNILNVKQNDALALATAIDNLIEAKSPGKQLLRKTGYTETPQVARPATEA